MLVTVIQCAGIADVRESGTLGPGDEPRDDFALLNGRQTHKTRDQEIGMNLSIDTPVRRTLALAGLAAVVWASSGSTQAQTSFAGQNVRFVVASTASGPTDTVARMFAPFVAKHIPGKPTLVIENRPGAVGAVAANYMYNVAKADGMTIGVMFGFVTQGLMQGAGIQFEPSKFQVLGAVSATQVVIARKDLALKAPRDLLMPAQPLVLASLGTGSTTDAANRLFLDMIGAAYKVVTGYPGQAEAILAVARGEASLANVSHTTYLARRESIVKEGLYDAFLQRGELTASGEFKRNAQLPNVPTMVEVIGQMKPAALESSDFAAYRSVVGSMAVHYSFVVPPKTPAQVVEVLRKAVADGMEDREARRTIPEMMKADYEFVNGVDSQRIVEKLGAEYAADPRIGNRLKEIMAVK